VSGAAGTGSAQGGGCHLLGKERTVKGGGKYYVIGKALSRRDSRYW